MASVGKITINGRPYNIAPLNEAYKVTEAPSHSDIDQKMERRVIYRNFSNGIQKRREDSSIDATATSNPAYNYNKQNRLGLGINWGNGGDTRQQDRIFAQRAVTASNFSNSQTPFLFGDASVYSWAVANQSVYVSTDSTTWSLSVSAAAPISDAIQYGGYLYIALGNGNNMYTWDQATTTTNWVSRAVAANNFVVIRNQLWRSNNASIYSTINTNPASQVWSGATVVGDPNTTINYLDVFEDFIMIFKQDGIYSADKSGNVYPIFPGFKTLGMNPRPLGQWRDSYFFASDAGLIWQYGKNGVERIGFDMAEPYPMGGNVFSVPYAVSRGIPLTNYFLVGFNQYAGTLTSGAYVLAWDGDGWQLFRYWANSIFEGMGITGGNFNPVDPHLQFSIQARSNNINQIYYMANPLIDPFLSNSFDTTDQVIYLTVDYGALEDEFKVLEKITCQVDNYAAGIVRMAYAIDDNITALTFQDLGAPQGDKSQGYQVFTPSIPYPDYRRIQLRITLTATVSTSSPIVRYLIMHYKQRVPQRRVWTITVLADQNLIGASGRIDARGTAKIISDLNKARLTHRQVPFIDALGVTYQVYVDEVGEQIHDLKGDTSPTYLVNLILIEASNDQTF